MEEWLLLRTGAGSAAFNMALDEALLLHARELNRPVLRFYAWSEPAASFGYFQRHAEVAKATPLRSAARVTVQVDRCRAASHVTSTSEHTRTRSSVCVS